MVNNTVQYVQYLWCRTIGSEKLSSFNFWKIPFGPAGYKEHEKSRPGRGVDAPRSEGHSFEPSHRAVRTFLHFVSVIIFKSHGQLPGVSRF